MLKAREQIPHFTVTTIDGVAVRYSTLWQRKNLVLIALSEADAAGAAAYVAAVSSLLQALPGPDETACIATREVVPGVPRPGVVVADRWGEVHFVDSAERVADLPAANEVVAWLRYVRMQCPECEGETR
jgi:hypothetical protein